MAIIRSRSTRASLHVSSDIASLCRLIAARRMPAISLAALGLAFAPHAQATVINVVAGDVTVNDPVNCSIVDAISAADSNTVVGACPAGDDSTNGGDTVVLPAFSTFAAAATLSLTRTITIEGTGRHWTVQMTIPFCPRPAPAPQASSMSRSPTVTGTLAAT